MERTFWNVFIMLGGVVSLFVVIVLLLGLVLGRSRFEPLHYGVILREPEPKQLYVVRRTTIWWRRRD